MSSKRKSAARRTLEMPSEEPSAKKNKLISDDSSHSTATLPCKSELLNADEILESVGPAETKPMLSPSKIEKPATKVDLHAMVTSISPMKKKHFVGELMDEKRSIRCVGFNPTQKNQLDALNDNKLPVLLTNCDVQLNQYSQSLEVIIKGYTRITESAMKFNISDPNTIGTTTITLDQLSNMHEYDKINVEAKIIDVGSPQVVNGGKTKQEIIIADTTGTATLTLWENDIDSLKLSECYSMKRLLVRIFNDTHYLSLPMNGAVIKPIADIPDVAEDINESMEPQMKNAEICGVKELELYKLCLACTNGKIVPLHDNSTIGQCQKCKMTVKLSQCTEEKSMAKIVLNGYSDKSTAPTTFITLVGYGDILKTITETEEVNMESLLNARPFNVTYNGYFVISSVSRD